MNVKCTEFGISHSLIESEYWGKNETFLIWKIPGISDRKNTFIWEVGRQRERGRGNKMNTESVSQ